ncbi:MAG: DUF4293 domain-containing protein [Muribaculum sp.]|nr:DUF4293 domain-containing protein [Muribaculum sp.]
MVIQRWQSLLLFISALIIGAELVFPIGNRVLEESTPDSSSVSMIMEEMYAFDVLPLFILLCLTFLLLLVDIFLYKNLRHQKQVALVCIFLSVVVSCLAAVYGSIFGVVMTVVSIVLTIWAYIRMKADERLLKSYDRIR